LDFVGSSFLTGAATISTGFFLSSFLDLTGSSFLIGLADSSYLGFFLSSLDDFLSLSLDGSSFAGFSLTSLAVSSALSFFPCFSFFLSFYFFYFSMNLAFFSLDLDTAPSATTLTSVSFSPAFCSLFLVFCAFFF
jgi:hypothetical protein